MDLAHFFAQPATAAHRQYEAVRAIVVDKLSAEAAAAKFYYAANTLYALMRDVRASKAELFPSAKKKGPKQRRTPDYMQSLVVDYRKQGLSCADVAEKLTTAGYKISTRTVENMVTDFNLPRLPRRTQAARGITHRNECIPLKATPVDFQSLEPFQMDCPVAGVFFFLP
jgi:transposase